MAWQPQAGQLVQLSQFLRDSLSGHDVAAQKHADAVCQDYDLFVRDMMCC
jgi:hypothetical protein